MGGVRVLTVRQPWAWAIIHGGKDVENRVRNIAGSYTGPVAIHAGLGWDNGWQSAALDDAMRPHRLKKLADHESFPWRENAGHIIGVVDLVETHLCSGGCSPWAQGPVDLGRGIRDLWHLAFTNPKSLPEPIPFRGALGLRRLCDDTTTRILAQIGEA